MTACSSSPPAMMTTCSGNWQAGDSRRHPFLLPAPRLRLGKDKRAPPSRGGGPSAKTHGVSRAGEVGAGLVLKYLRVGGGSARSPEGALVPCTGPSAGSCGRTREPAEPRRELQNLHHAVGLTRTTCGWRTPSLRMMGNAGIEPDSAASATVCPPLLHRRIVTVEDGRKHRLGCA